MKWDAQRIILNLLARREHSQEELRRKLLLKKIAPEEFEPILRQVIEEGWQSNLRFTEAYIRMRMEKGYGPLKIHAELRERGIQDDLINECLEPYKKDWEHYLANAWQKKFAGKIARDTKHHMKQVRFLQQRGFEPSQINRFLRRCDTRCSLSRFAGEG